MMRNNCLIPAPNWPNHDGQVFANWAGELTYPNTTDFDTHRQLYRDMVAWIMDNVADYRHNTCWAKIGDCIYIHFRKSADLTWFALRWQ